MNVKQFSEVAAEISWLMYDYEIGFDMACSIYLSSTKKD